MNEDSQGPAEPDFGTMPGVNSSPTGSSFHNGSGRRPGRAELAITVVLILVAAVVFWFVVIC